MQSAEREEVEGKTERRRESCKVAGKVVEREESRAASPDPPAEHQGSKAPSSTISQLSEDVYWTAGSILALTSHLQSPYPDTKFTSWRMFESQLFTQLRPVHDGIDAFIPRLQTRTSPSTRMWTVHIHTPLTVLFRHKIGHIISQRFFLRNVLFNCFRPSFRFLPDIWKVIPQWFDKSGHFRDRSVCLWFVLVGLCLWLLFHCVLSDLCSLEGWRTDAVSGVSVCNGLSVWVSALSCKQMAQFFPLTCSLSVILTGVRVVPESPRQPRTAVWTVNTQTAPCIHTHTEPHQRAVHIVNKVL